MTDDPHVCTCGDCSPVPYADRCQHEGRVAELEAAIEEWWKWCSRNGWGAGDATLYNTLCRGSDDG